MPPNAKNNGFNGVVSHLNTMGGLLNQIKGKLTGYNTAAKNAANVGAYGHQNITTALNANRNAKLKNLTKNVKLSNVNLNKPKSLNNNSAHPEASNENKKKLNDFLNAPNNESLKEKQDGGRLRKNRSRKNRSHKNRKNTRRH